MLGMANCCRNAINLSPFGYNQFACAYTMYMQIDGERQAFWGLARRQQQLLYSFEPLKSPLWVCNCSHCTHEVMGKCSVWHFRLMFLLVKVLLPVKVVWTLRYEYAAVDIIHPSNQSFHLPYGLSAIKTFLEVNFLLYRLVITVMLVILLVIFLLRIVEVMRWR